MQSPYLRRVQIDPARVDAWTGFPFDLPFVRGLDLELRAAVTFLVGENGSGKSTLLEGIASMLGLPVGGGGLDDLAARTGPDDGAPLGRALRPSRTPKRPRDTYFFRSEHLAHFAELLDARRADPDFTGDPYARYGGRTLHSRSHGEAFLAVLTNRLASGLYLMDEPEAALSPQRQLALLARMWQLVEGGATQFLIATHAPILMTFPGAVIMSFDGGALREVSLAETTHYALTRSILESPERYWKHLRGD